MKTLMKIEKFVEKAELKHDDKYDYSLVNYKSSKDKVLIICDKHGHFYQQPAIHIAGSGCPNCFSSQGELAIKNFLENLKICFEQEFRFQQCRNSRSLPFDFAIKLNDNILGLIEYHGEQHYRSVDYWHGSYEKTKFRDDIKNNFCMSNNIPLLIIPYHQKNNIESLVNNFINKIGVK